MSLRRIWLMTFVAATVSLGAHNACASSGWFVQIAAQPNAESARAVYNDLVERFSSVIGERAVEIVAGTIEGRGTTWRVRLPTRTREEADSLCRDYKAAGGSCFAARDAPPTADQETLQALRRQIQRCWNVPTGNYTKVKILAIIDGTTGALVERPRPIEAIDTRQKKIAADSAIRAILACAPYTILVAVPSARPFELTINFDPTDIF